MFFFKIDTNTSDAYKKGALVWERTGSYNEGRFHFLLNNDDNASNVDLTDSKVTILSTGNVGIGTVNPASKFEVYGGNSGVNDVDRYIRFKASNGEKRFDFYVGGTGNASSLGMYTSDGTTKNVQIASGGTSYFNGGNVGIGTTSPADKLHVSAGAIRLDNFYQLRWDGTGTGIYGHSSQGLNFFTNTGSTRLKIENGGNVGIGTTSPAHKLTVNAPNDTTAVGIDFPSAHFDFAADSTSGYNTLFKMDNTGLDIGHDSTARSLNLKTGNLDRVTILGNGNVGIGTTSPGVKLHLVSGTGVPYSLRLNSDATGTWQLGVGSTGYYDGSFLLQDASVGDRLRIDTSGTFTLPAYNSTNQTGTPTYLLGTDASGNIVKTNTIPGSDPGPYLPLAGGTMTGNIVMDSANIDIKSSSGVVGTILSSSDSLTLNARYTGDMIFQSGGAEKMRIANGGNVGIGTTSPSQKLEVVGNIKADSTGNTQVILESGGSCVMDLLNAQSEAYLRTTTAHDLHFRTTNLNRMVIKAGGNVGIGTTSPQAQLTLSTTMSSSPTTQIYLDVDGTNAIGGGSEIIFNSSASGGSLVNYNAKITGTRSSANDGSSDLSFFTTLVTSATAPAVRMTIKDNGNVGIGTTSPSQLLSIYKNSGDANFLINSNNGASQIFFGDTESDNVGNIRYDHGSNYMRFSTNAAEKMRIDSSGNVGIGQTSPTAKLYVQGDTIVRGVLRGDNVNFGLGGAIKVNASNTASDQYVAFGTTPSGSSGAATFTEKMRITSTGSVGIGTTSPGTKLQVGTGSGATVDTAYQIVADGSAISGIQILSGATQSGRLVFGDSGNNDVGIIKYDHSNNSLQTIVNAAERMRIDASGNVGIGVTSIPSWANLITSGTVAVGGRLYIKSNNSIQGLSGFPGSSDKLIINPDGGNVGVGTTSPTAKLHVAGTGLFTGLVSGITPVAAANFVTKAYVDGSGGGTGPFLPLAGGTMTGTGSIDTPDQFKLRFGAGNDFQIYHQGGTSGSYIDNYSGNMRFNNYGNDTDIVFSNDDGSGGTTEYFRLDGSIADGTNIGTRFPDQSIILLGSGSGWSDGAQIYHSGTNTHISNYVGNLDIRNYADDGDIIFRNDDGSGGITEYFRLDGGSELTFFSKAIQTADNAKIFVGNAGDLQIYHDGSNSYIRDTGTGNLYIDATSQIIFRDYGSAEEMAKFINDGAVELYYDNSKKFETTNTGVTVTGAVTATTFLGDLNGTINTATTAVTKANATNDTTVATTAFVQNLIGTIPAGLVFQGTWNAATNTPTLTSGSGTTGHFYIVSTDGSTNLDGITDWKVGDWAVFVEQGASDQWEKVDNSSVLDGSGTGGSVAGWAGSGTSNTLTNAPITFSGNNTTFAGDISIADKLIHSGDTNTYLSFSGADNIKLVASGKNVLHAHDNGNLYLYGNNGTALTLDGSQNATFAGNVGIGTSPSVNLDIEDSSNVIVDMNTTTANANTTIRLQESGTVKATIGYDGTNNGLILTTGGFTAGNGIFIDDTQKVGIGTASPTHLLTLETASSPGIKIKDTTQGATLLAFSQDSNSHLGTYSAHPLVLDTNSTERIRITSAGNVGIGTTSPSKKLDVNGQTQFYEYTGAHLTNQATSNFNFNTLANNTSSTDGGSVGAYIKLTGTPPGATGRWSAFRARAYGENAKGNTDDMINFFAEYRNYTSTNAVTLSHHAGLKVNSLGVGGLATVTNNYGVYLNPGTAATNNYGVYQLGTGVKNFFQGNVGIGTTTPSEKIDVQGNIKLRGTNNLTIGSTSDGGNFSLSSGIRGFNFANNNGDLVRIDGDGKVGIGTTSPQSKLQVAGGIQMADDTATASAAKVGTMRYRTGTEYVDVTGTDLVTNGDFATDTNWAKGTGVTIASGVGTWTNTANNVGLTQSVTFTSNAYYRCNVTVSNYSSGSFRFRYPGISSPRITANGTYSLIIQANQSANSTLFLQGETNGDTNVNFSIDNVSVVEVTAEDASYADMCMQTGSSTYEWVNIVRNTY